MRFERFSTLLTMLRKQCSLYDIDDVEAFIIMCINRSGIKPHPREWEDLIAEGVCILWSMSLKYEPHRPGYDKPGRFSGYAIKYMPRKMKEAYHRSHEHHLHVTQDDGTRKWEFKEQALSLNKLMDPLHGSSEANGGVGRIALDETKLRLVGDFVECPQQKA